MNRLIAVVCIGRNEGERLKQCLLSISSNIPVIYVDSGSTDDSLEFARNLGIKTINLDTTNGFTAARARNAGWQAFASGDSVPDFIQFIDGDCELAKGWLDAGLGTLQSDPALACVFGRRRERYPERSIFNQMCDDEWNSPIGEAAHCGGDAMFRMSALSESGGYADDLIAGEEPDLCLRLSRSGWRFRRIEKEMTLHDANIQTLSAWWRRCRRAGFAYAEHVWRHRSQALPNWRKQLLSIVLWGFILPIAALISLSLGVTIAPLGFGLAIAIAALSSLQIWKIARYKRGIGVDGTFAWKYACFIMCGKMAEAGGVRRCLTAHLKRKQSQLIEYK